VSTTGTAIAVRGAAAVAGLDVVGVNDDDIRNARSVLRRHTDQADHELACVVCGGVVPCLPVRLAGELLTRASWVPRGGTADRAAVPGAWGDAQSPVPVLPVRPGGWVSPQVGAAGAGGGATSPVPGAPRDG